MTFYVVALCLFLMERAFFMKKNGTTISAGRHREINAEYVTEPDVLDYLEVNSYDNSILEEYEKRSKHKTLFIFLLVFAIILVGMIAVTIGPLKISVSDSYKVIISHIFPSVASVPDTIKDNTIWQVRLPRVLAGILVGFGLAISGAVMQPVLKNPMASPFTLGVSAAAGFGASLAIALGASVGSSTISVIGYAFLFSMLSVTVILFISKIKNSSPEVIILTGIALSYLFNAGITMLQYFVDPIYTKQMVFWLSGSLYKGNWENLAYICPVVVILSVFLIIKSKDLNAISSGDETAKSVGINVERTRLVMLVVSTVLTATVVSFMGAIGFIGLVAPHIVRLVIGADNRFVVIGSGFAGAFLLVVSDIVAMNIISPVALPIGVITSFMGVPLFLYLVLKMKKGGL